MSSKIYQFYQELYRKHGEGAKFWPQWCAKKKNKKLKDLVVLGAILTQRTSWHNAEIALNNLKKENLFSLEAIAKLDSLDKLTQLVRPAGFFQTKPKRLYNLANFIVKKYGNLNNFAHENLKTAREKLLFLKGIGPETADTILLYALNKPTFVIDEYTKRWVAKNKLAEVLTYDFLQKLFEKNLPKDTLIYQNFHILIIVEQKGEKESLMEIV